MSMDKQILLYCILLDNLTLVEGYTFCLVGKITQFLVEIISQMHL